jgi:hypothetical protein
VHGPKTDASGLGGRRPAVVAVLALVTFASTIPLVPAVRLPISSPTAAVSPRDEPTLTVDPPSWWLGVGNTTTLTASWTPSPPGCAVAPAWFLWTPSGDPPLGSLSSVAGASVNFTAAANRSGNERISVQSAGSLDCGGSSEPVSGEATSTLTVVAGLSLVNLSIGPGPVRPGTPVELTGTIVGGLGPYLLGIGWTDGSRASLARATPGPFSVSHVFPGGRFDPYVSLVDALGSVVAAEAPEPIEVSDGAAASIDASVDGGEVGAPVQFSARFAGAPGGYPPFALCNGAPPLWTSLEPGGENFSCVFSTIGSATVLAGLGSPNLPAASNTLRVAVAEPLAVRLPPPATPGEVGAAAPIAVGISGGVAPFQITVSLLGDPQPVTVDAASDGGSFVPVDPPEAGVLPCVVNVTDALGVEATATTEITIDPSLALATSVGRSLGTGASSIEIDAVATDGSPPFFWFVHAPNGTWSSEGPTAGVSTPGAPFSWSGSVDPERSQTLTLEVLDALGASANATVTSLAAAPFVGQLSAIGGPTGELEIAADLEGGVPPFSLFVNASDGEEWTASAGGDGTYDWSLPVHTGGATNLTLTMLDRYGYALEANSTVDLVTRSNGSSGSGPWGPVAAILVVALLGAVALWWRRRRRTRPVAPSPPDPEEVLQRILEPADGADRTTVELLAEEGGVPLDVARTTIDRLVADGRIRSETTPEGEEVLAWSPNGSP